MQKAIRQLSPQDPRAGKVPSLWQGKTANLEIRPCAHGAQRHLRADGKAMSRSDLQYLASSHRLTADSLLSKLLPTKLNLPRFVGPAQPFVRLELIRNDGPTCSSGAPREIHSTSQE